MMASPPAPRAFPTRVRGTRRARSRRSSVGRTPPPATPRPPCPRPPPLHKVQRGVPPETAADVLATARVQRLALRPGVVHLLRSRSDEVALVHVLGQLLVLVVVRRLDWRCSRHRGSGAAAALPAVGILSVMLRMARSGAGGMGLGREPPALRRSVVTPFLQREASRRYLSASSAVLRFFASPALYRPDLPL